jgi:D-arabinose 1-dehydrogenase-like Zn-dependent alcohol dehydrogenase
MKAAVIEQFGEPLKIHGDWADPECGPSDAVIKVEACGVCRSDYTIWNGGIEWMGIVPALPAVLGHEYCGVVEEVGSDVTRFKKGDRVVSPFNHACGSCEFCDSGHQNVCANLQLPSVHYTGGYAGYTKVANADVNLVTLPDAISFADAASLGCRFVTSYHGVVDQAAVQPGEWVAVFACGGVGLAAVNIAAALGAQVIAVSRSSEKLALAKVLGAAHTVTAGEGTAEEIKELTGGGVHVSVDALGAAETALPGIMSLRPRGRHLRLGASNKKDFGQISIPVDMILFQELSIIGSFGMQAARFPEMLQMIASEKLTPGRMVGDTVALEGASDVLASMGGYDTVAMSVITSF